MKRNKEKSASLVIGLVILALFILMAFCPKLFTPYLPKEIFKSWLTASKDHLLGTESLGYDIFTQLVYACKKTLLLALFSTGLALIFGAFIGLLAATKNLLSGISNLLINVFVMLPRLVCIIVLSCYFNDTKALAFIIAGFAWPGIAKNVKIKVQGILQEEYIKSLKVYGFSNLKICFNHIIPGIFDVLLSNFLSGIQSNIMMESMIGFLGIGDLYNLSWGSMVNMAYKNGAFLRRAYGYLLSPGICVGLLVLAFYLISSYFESRKEKI